MIVFFFSIENISFVFQKKNSGKADFLVIQHLVVGLDTTMKKFKE
jgi:hypothetical protein